MVKPLLQIGGTVAWVAALIAWTGPAARWVHRRWERHRRRRAARPGRRPLQVVAADVRRLGRQIALVPAGAPMARRRALAAAYDDVLIEAALLLDVPHDLRTRRPARSATPQRLRLLADLEEAGLAVHGLSRRPAALRRRRPAAGGPGAPRTGASRRCATLPARRAGRPPTAGT